MEMNSGRISCNVWLGEENGVVEWAGKRGGRCGCLGRAAWGCDWKDKMIIDKGEGVSYGLRAYKVLEFWCIKEKIIMR